MKKKILILIIFAIILVAIVVIIKNNKSENEISEDYILVFSGGAGEIVYKVYVYDEGGKYKYISATLMTTSWGSNEWVTRIDKVGYVDTIEEIIEIAQKYNCGSITCSDEELLTNIEDIINPNEVHSQHTFNAIIKRIRKSGETAVILAVGIENMNPSYQEEFEFSIDYDTKLLWEENEIELSDLKAGQQISITFSGEILETSPAVLEEVTEVVVNDQFFILEESYD